MDWAGFRPANALIDRGGELQGNHHCPKPACKLQKGAALRDVEVAAVNHYLQASSERCNQSILACPSAPQGVLPDTPRTIIARQELNNATAPRLAQSRVIPPV